MSNVESSKLPIGPGEEWCSADECFGELYGKGYCREHYSRWTPPADEINAAIIERRDWPSGSHPDEMLYSLECERAMRPLMTEEGRSSEFFEYDEEGNIQWVPVDPDAEKMPTTSHVGQTGTYAVVSRTASRLNNTQVSVYGRLAWIYSPAPIEKLAA